MVMPSGRSSADEEKCIVVKPRLVKEESSPRREHGLSNKPPADSSGKPGLGRADSSSRVFLNTNSKKALRPTLRPGKAKTSKPVNGDSALNAIILSDGERTPRGLRAKRLLFPSPTVSRSFDSQAPGINATAVGKRLAEEQNSPTLGPASKRIATSQARFVPTSPEPVGSVFVGPITKSSPEEKRRGQVRASGAPDVAVGDGKKPKSELLPPKREHEACEARLLKSEEVSARQLKELRQQMQEERDKHQQVKQTLLSEKDALEKELKQSEATAKARGSLLADSKVKIGALEKDCGDAREKNRDLEEKVREQTVAIASLERETEVLRSRIQGSIRDTATEQAKVVQLEKANSHLQANLDNIQNTLQAEREIAKLSSSTLASKSEKLKADAERETHKLIKAIDRLRSEVDSLTRERDEHVMAHTELLAELVKQREETSTLRRDKTQLTDEGNRLLQKISTAENTGKEVLSAQKRQMEDLERKNKTLEEEQSRMKKLNEELEAKLERYEALHSRIVTGLKIHQGFSRSFPRRNAAMERLEQTQIKEEVKEAQRSQLGASDSTNTQRENTA